MHTCQQLRRAFTHPTAQSFLLQEYGTLSDEAVIVGIKDESLDLYLFRIGVPVRAGINVSVPLRLVSERPSLSLSEPAVGSSAHELPEIVR